MLLEAVDCGVAVIDRSMSLKALSSSATDLAGSSVSPGKGVNTCHERLFGLEDRCPGCPAAEALRTGSSASGTVCFHERVFEVRVVPEGDTGLLVCCFREVTHSAALLARLEASEKQYSRIVNGIPSAIVIGEIISDSRGKPVDYKVVETNPFLEDHTGVSADKILNKRITKVFPNMREHLGVDLFANVVVTGEPVELCGFNMLIHRFVHFFVFCVQPGRFACIINDLSEKKAVEDRLRLVESAVETSSDEIYFLNEQGCLIYCNSAVCESLGVMKEQLRNTHVSSINPSATPEWWRDFLVQVRQRGHFQIESTHRRGDGTVYPVEINSTLVKTDRSQMICVIARDTTVQTTELSALSRSRDHMERALDAASLCFWTHSPLSGKFTSDRRWASLTGQGDLPLSGDADSMLYPAVHVGDRRRLRLELTSSPYESGTIICRLSAGEGAGWVRIRWHKTRDKSGLRIVALSDDITSERVLGLAAAGSDSSAMDALTSYSEELGARLAKAAEAASSGDLGAVQRLLSDMTADIELLVPDTVGNGEVIYLSAFLRELEPTLLGLLGGDRVLSMELPPTIAVHGSAEFLERFFLRLAGYAGCVFPEGATMRVWALSGAGASGCERITIDFTFDGSLSGVSPSHSALVEAYASVRAMRGSVSGVRTPTGARFSVSLPSAALEPSGRVIVATCNPVEGRTVATVLRHMNLRVMVTVLASEAMSEFGSGDALVISSGLGDFPKALPARTLVLGSGYDGPALNLSRSWTITELRSAIRRVLQRS